MSAIVAPLPWQQAVWQQLGEQIEEDHLHHASLLAGPSGVGKRRFGQALAARLLCADPQSGLNCGTCHACDLVAAGTHTDLLQICPEGDSRVIKIEQIRALVSAMSKTASLGERKVILIMPAEAMNLSAANALLKSLEEPGDNTFLILISDMPGQLPATLRSRCQLLRFPVPVERDASAWLDTVTGEQSRSEELLQLSNGAPIAAADLFSDSEKLQSLQLIHQTLEKLAAREYSAVEAAQSLAKASMLDVLTQVEQVLQQRLKRYSASVLTKPGVRASFELLDKIVKWRAALAAGTNPNTDLLKQQVLLDFDKALPLQS